MPDLDWRIPIAELLSVRSKIYEIDKGQLWGYALPRLAASEDDILMAERRLGRRLDPGYRRFLTFANGWAHVAQDGLLFGTGELGQGEDWAAAVESLDAISEPTTHIAGAQDPRRIIPILSSATTPSLVVQGDSASESAVTWYYGGSPVDRWPDFETYFYAVIELARDDLQAVKTDPQLRALLGD